MNSVLYSHADNLDYLLSWTKKEFQGHEDEVLNLFKEVRFRGVRYRVLDQHIVTTAYNSSRMYKFV